MKIDKLEKLWNEFSDFQLNINDCIEIDFHIWKAGTSRVHIWKWFNKSFTYGLYYQSFSLAQLEMLWNDFSEVPINNEDEILNNFYCWKKGTFRFDVWHWLDEKLPNGIAYLI